MSHRETKSLLKSSLHQDDTGARCTLAANYRSESSRNIRKLELSHKKLKKWSHKLEKNRVAQEVMITSITDTAFRLNGDRLPCPHCPGHNLSLAHILYSCAHLSHERQNAWNYTKGTRGNKKDYVKTDLLPNICAAAKKKIRAMTNLARSRHPIFQVVEQVPDQNQEN